MPPNSNNSSYTPLKFREEFVHQAYIACKHGGFTDQKLADLFEVTRDTISRWKRERTEFKDALVKGKDEYDCGKVEKALNKRAVGYSYNETHKKAVWIDVTEDTPTHKGKKELPTRTVIRSGTSVKQVQVTLTSKVIRKMVPPDTKACEIWLCNRNPDRWKKLKHVELAGPGGESILNAPMLSTILGVIEEIKGPEYVEALKQALVKDATSESK